MSNENINLGQLRLFEEGTVADQQAASEQAAAAERARQVAQIAAVAHGPSVDPEKDDILIRNREDGSGFSVRSSERSVQTPAEAGENTAARPKRQPRQPKPPTSNRGRAFADLGRIPQHELERKHEHEGWEDPEDR